MSVARWCDYAEHAFKGGRKNTVMMGVLTDENGNQDVREMCPECAGELGLVDYEAPAESPAVRKAMMLKELQEGKK